MLSADASAPVAPTFSIENVNLLIFVVPKCGLWHRLISCGCTAHHSDIAPVSPISIHTRDSMWKRLNSILLHAVWHYVLSLAYMGFVWISSAANFPAQIAAAEVTKLIVCWSSPSATYLGDPTVLWQDNGLLLLHNGLLLLDNGLLLLCKYKVKTNVNDDIFKSKHRSEPVSGKYFIKNHFCFLNQWNERFLRQHHIVKENRNTALIFNMPSETLELLPFLELIWQLISPFDFKTRHSLVCNAPFSLAVTFFLVLLLMSCCVPVQFFLMQQTAF